MDCPTCEAMVDAYVDGELSAQESVAFEQALDTCPECRKRLEAARAMSGLLREIPPEPAPDLLRARIERELRAISGTAAPQRARTMPQWAKSWRWPRAWSSRSASAGWAVLSRDAVRTTRKLSRPISAPWAAIGRSTSPRRIGTR